MSTQDRYSRQIRFAPLGAEGQRRIAGSTVLLVGVGALGSHLADTLVRAGVGRIVLVDRDIVELSNLQRQVLYLEADAATGRPKAIAAAAHLRRVNSECVIEPVVEDFLPAVYEDLNVRPDLILDGTDNFATRFMLNDLAHREGVPFIYGGAVGAAGTAMVILPGETPCLRCLLPQAPATGEGDTCETVGVVAPAVQMVTAFQAGQALKILTGHRDEAARGIYIVDVWADDYGLRMQQVRSLPDCVTCQRGEYPALAITATPSVKLCGRNAVQVHPRAGATVDLDRLAKNLGNTAADLEVTPHLLRFRVEGCRFSVFPGGRALLFGTEETERARILYDRYVGA
ncbi:MAG: ThiF family adenylyltransferase [Planctomycetota bacterium]|jgi:adenylyltransferase/sulfurtransferase